MKILVIRTDNIGDLVCTTPLLRVLREQYPKAWIGLLTSSYAAPALVGHPDLDELLVYHKVKHLGGQMSALASYIQRARLIWRLRRMHLDTILIPAVGGQSSALRFARWLNARRVVANTDCGQAHEVEKVFSLLESSGMAPAGPIPPCYIPVSPQHLAPILQRHSPPPPGVLRIGLHISARKPSQRWPAECFAEFATAMSRQRKLEFLLFWSPGEASDAKHPGDDEKARQILAMASVPILPVPTHTLPELIAGLSLCHVMLQSDGGAMHLAAALGKPIVCLFGDSPLERWHPWGVDYEAIQPSSLDISSVDTQTVISAMTKLLSRYGIEEAVP